MPRSSPTDESSRRGRGPAGRRRVRVLNIRLLVGTLIAATVLGVAGYFWHAYQVDRTANAWLEQADALEQEEEWEEAAGYVYRYMQIRPDDAQARVRFVEIFDQSAKDPRRKEQAIDHYYRTLGAIASTDDPRVRAKESELRSRLGELLLERGRFPAAEAEARKLLELDENDPQGKRLLALSLYGQFLAGGLVVEADAGPAIGEVFEDAMELSPGDVKLASAFARIVREEAPLLGDGMQTAADAERRRMGDEIIDRMVAADPQNPEALLARYLYRTEYGLPGAAEDLTAALALGPDNVSVVLIAAAHAQTQARQAEQQSGPAIAADYYAEAQTHYEHAIELDPADEWAYLGLGQVHIAQHQTDLAIEAWRRGLEQAGKESLRLNAYLAEVLIEQGKLDQAEQTLETLDRVIRQLSPRLPPATVAAHERSVALLRARWLMARGDSRGYLQAVPFLRRVALGQKSTDAEVALAVQAWELLGGACAMLGQWDRAALAYEEAAALHPEIFQFHVKAAAAWSNAGRAEKAILRYGEALRLEDSKAIRVSLARARFQREVALPAAERDWEPFRLALAEAKACESDGSDAVDWSLAFLEADSIVVSAEEGGTRAEGATAAADLLRQVETEYSDSLNFLEGLVTAYDRLGFPADADRALKRYENLNGGSLAACLLRAGHATRQEQYGEAREVLRAGIETLPVAAHARLQYELSQISLREGKLAQARAELSQLHESNPSNLEVTRQLTELALDAGDIEDAQRWEKALRELEGSDGLNSRYFEARRLLVGAEGYDDPALVTAARLQASIQSERPEWPSAYLLGGLISQQQGKLDQAIEAYQQAIRLGERRVIVYEGLILLLNQVGRVAEADQYLSRMQDQVAASERLSSLELIVAARLGQLDRAIEVAHREVERRPEDAMARVRLGQLLLADEKPSEAETVFQEAVKLDPADPRSYNALFICYLRMDQPDRAREVLEDLAEHADLPQAQQAFVLAQAYEQLGDPEQAEASYREAKRLAPDDTAIESGLADFLARKGEYDEARDLLRHVLELAPASGETRRRLAAVLAAQGGEAEWEEAQRLLEEAGADQDISSLDERLQARLLLRRGGEENLTRARQLLETLVADSANSVDGDRLTLARVYEVEGKLQLARQQYTSLLGRAEPSPSHLALYVDMLLRHELGDEAATWLEELEKTEPDGLDTVGLRARWLQGEDRTPEIEPLVEAFAERRGQGIEGPEQEAQLALNIGSIYTSVEQHSAAERWYRRLRELVPERYDALALSLARQDRTAEATRLCIEAAESDSSARPATLLALILGSAQAGEEDFRLAEPVLAEALQSHSDDAELLFNIANVRIAQQQTESAVQLYRQVVRIEPNHLLALNNLATLLSEDPNAREQSWEYVNRAILIAGQQPGLLDTKAMILVYEGKADEAVPLLEKAAAVARPDPRYNFHLAVAYHRLGETEKARDALDKALDGGLASTILTEGDRNLQAELEQGLRP